MDIKESFLNGIAQPPSQILFGQSELPGQRQINVPAALRIYISYITLGDDWKQFLISMLISK